VKDAIPDGPQPGPHYAAAVTGAPTRPSASAGALRRMILPLLCALGLRAAIEGSVQLIWHPSFWQKATWLMHDPFHGGEIFDWLELYIRLSHLENSAPDIISISDSSGFCSLQSIAINRFTAPVKFLSLHSGVNQNIAGYAAIAEYMLRHSHHIRYVVLYLFPQFLPEPIPMEVADLGPITYDDLASFRAYLTPPSVFASPYAKAWMFDDWRFHPSDMVDHNVPSLQSSEHGRCRARMAARIRCPIRSGQRPCVVRSGPPRPLVRLSGPH
jgi:hypothetical protein